MNPPPPPDEPSSPPTWKSFWSWLFTPSPVELANVRADRFYARLRSSNAEIANRAEGELRRIAQSWESYEYDAPFVMAVLRLLTTSRDPGYLPYIERMIEAPARSTEQILVQTAAIACKETLQDHSEEERTRRTLLRASETPPASPETLLRPADGATETAPDELLRASRRNPEP